MTTKSRIYLYTALTLAAIAALSTSAHAGAGPVQPKPAVVVNVNTATPAQLALLPGVGPKLADEIYKIAEAGFYIYNPEYFDQVNKRWIKDPADNCDHRCHIKSLADLDNVKGIGPAKLRAMAPFVVFDGETTATSKIRVAKQDGAK